MMMMTTTTLRLSDKSFSTAWLNAVVSSPTRAVPDLFPMGVASASTPWQAAISMSVVIHRRIGTE